MQKILLTLEFLVLGGALFSLFVKSQFRGKFRASGESRRRHPRILPEPADMQKSQPAPEILRRRAGSGARPTPPRGGRQARPFDSIRLEGSNHSEAMNALVDCIVREKNLVPRKASDSRINIILDAFIERRKVPLEARIPMRSNSAGQAR